MLNEFDNFGTAGPDRAFYLGSRPDSPPGHQFSVHAVHGIGFAGPPIITSASYISFLCIDFTGDPGAPFYFLEQQSAAITDICFGGNFLQCDRISIRPGEPVLIFLFKPAVARMDHFRDWFAFPGYHPLYESL
jgi:hypothetical protein